MVDVEPLASVVVEAGVGVARHVQPCVAVDEGEERILVARATGTCVTPMDCQRYNKPAAKKATAKKPAAPKAVAKKAAPVAKKVVAKKPATKKKAGK